MCPAGDNKWSKDAMYETFLLSNICPQDRNLNNGVWNQIEMACRNWAERYGDVYIVCGPVPDRDTSDHMGRNHILVPEAFFKVVLCMGKHPKGIGFVVENKAVKGKKGQFVRSITEVEEITGIEFFTRLDKSTSKKVKSHANLSEW